ncbi:MAG: hypothetical protein ACJ780_13570 [Solirubrobacteraceae bacterium]
MSLEQLETPSSPAAPPPTAIHRRWLLSKRVGDGRRLLVREDRVAEPSDFVTRPRRPASGKTADPTRGTPALN